MRKPVWQATEFMSGLYNDELVEERDSEFQSLDLSAAGVEEGGLAGTGEGGGGGMVPEVSGAGLLPPSTTLVQHRQGGGGVGGSGESGFGGMGGEGGGAGFGRGGAAPGAGVGGGGGAGAGFLGWGGGGHGLEVEDPRRALGMGEEEERMGTAVRRWARRAWGLGDGDRLGQGSVGWGGQGGQRQGWRLDVWGVQSQGLVVVGGMGGVLEGVTLLGRSWVVGWGGGGQERGGVLREAGTGQGSGGRVCKLR